MDSTLKLLLIAPFESIWLQLLSFPSEMSIHLRLYGYIQQQQSKGLNWYFCTKTPSISVYLGE